MAKENDYYKNMGKNFLGDIDYRMDDKDIVNFGGKYYEWSTIREHNQQMLDMFDGNPNLDMRSHFHFCIFWDEGLQYTGYGFYEYMRDIYNNKLGDFSYYQKCMPEISFGNYIQREFPDPLLFIVDTILPISMMESLDPYCKEVEEFVNLRIQKYHQLRHIYRSLYRHDLLFRISPISGLFEELYNLVHIMKSITIVFRHDSQICDDIFYDFRGTIANMVRDAGMSPINISKRIFDIDDRSDPELCKKNILGLITSSDIIYTQHIHDFISCSIDNRQMKKTFIGPADHNGFDMRMKSYIIYMEENNSRWPFGNEVIFRRELIDTPKNSFQSDIDIGKEYNDGEIKNNEDVITESEMVDEEDPGF